MFCRVASLGSALSCTPTRPRVPGLRLVQALVRDGHDLLQDFSELLLPRVPVRRRAALVHVLRQASVRGHAWRVREHHPGLLVHVCHLLSAGIPENHWMNPTGWRRRSPFRNGGYPLLLQPLGGPARDSRPLHPPNKCLPNTRNGEEWIYSTLSILAPRGLDSGDTHRSQTPPPPKQDLVCSISPTWRSNSHVDHWDDGGMQDQKCLLTNIPHPSLHPTPHGRAHVPKNTAVIRV